MRIREVEARRTWVPDVQRLARIRRALDLDQTCNRTLEKALTDALIKLLVASPTTIGGLRQSIARTLIPILGAASDHAETEEKSIPTNPEITAEEASPPEGAEGNEAEGGEHF